MPWPGWHCGTFAERTAARNRALLWLLWDGGLRVAELCVLRRNDVFPQQGIVRIRGAGTQERRIALGPEGQQALRVYLDLTGGGCSERTASEALFQTDRGTPLTIKFVRLNQRLNLPGIHISASMLRDTFAVRYLQNGGHLEALQQRLGLNDLTSVKRYQQAYERFVKSSTSGDSHRTGGARGSIRLKESGDT